MQPFFLPGEGGGRFCVFRAPVSSPRGAVIYLHPFAEEMNKSRQMVALQARELVSAGYYVLQIDLFGCGDSSGDFADATWQAWRTDALMAYRWLRSQTDTRIVLWGLRAGCLLAASVANEIPEDVDFIFWQPVISGKQHLQQFLRLKLASELTSGNSKGVMERLKSQLASGNAVEIAGYSISPALAAGLEGSILVPPNRSAGGLHWVEISAMEGSGLTPASKNCIAEWEGSGYAVNSSACRGPAFWQTTEIEILPNLVNATIKSLRDRA